MPNFISSYFKGRKRKQLLAEINRAYPELAEVEEDKRFEQYMMSAVELFMQQQQLYEQACQSYTEQERANTLLANPPVMPWLLAQVLMHWADQPSYAYAFLMMQKEIENVRLRAQVKLYQQLEGLYKQQEAIAYQLADIANDAQKAIDEANQSVLPENRMN